MRRTFLSIVAVVGLGAAHAQQIVFDAMDAERPEKTTLIVPFAFRTEMLSTGAGLAYVSSGGKQEQQAAYLATYYTRNRSYAVFTGISDRQLLSDRLFFSPRLGWTQNTNQRFYGETSVRRAVDGSGSNASSPLDLQTGSGTDSYLELEFRYVLPLGDGKDEPLHRYQTDDGILVGGSTHAGGWNPKRGGRTILVVQPFYQARSLKVTDENIGQFPPPTGLRAGDTAKNLTNGIAVRLDYDNRDFRSNPTMGSHSWMKVERDFGAFDSTESWTAIQGSFAKYFSLGTSAWFKQQVLAVRAWAAYAPTWTVREIGDDLVEIDHRPPSNRGATLGGNRRMRAYPRGRFNDKSAVYYSAELRLIPNWDPLRNWPLIRRWPWRWWQWVAFAEAGRVAEHWEVELLHKDMHWDFGIGARMMVGGAVARVDFAVAEESRQVTFFVNQTF